MLAQNGLKSGAKYGEHIRKINGTQLYFNLLLVYYWIFKIYSIVKTSEIKQYSIEYYFLILPVEIYIVLNIPSIILKKRISKSSLFLLIFVVLTGFVSFIRLDFATAYNISILSLAIIVLLEKKVNVNLRLINILFIVSIAFSIYTTYIGLNKWGFSPFIGLSKVDRIRVSLYPVQMSFGVFFSLFVLIINYFQNKKKSRWFFILLSLYFVIFSLSRTAIAGLIVIGMAVYLWKFKKYLQNIIYGIFPIAIIVIFIVVVLESSFFLRSHHFRDGYFGILFFRTLKSNEEIYSIASYRNYMWIHHFLLFKESPFIGNGTVRNLFNEYNFGSEAFLTSLLARVGFLIVPFIMFFIHQLKLAIRRNNIPKYCLLCLIPIMMLAYGSHIVPYNFLFLLMFGLLAMFNYTDNWN